MYCNRGESTGCPTGLAFIALLFSCFTFLTLPAFLPRFEVKVSFAAEGSGTAFNLVTFATLGILAILILGAFAIRGILATLILGAFAIRGILATLILGAFAIRGILAILILGAFAIFSSTGFSLITFSSTTFPALGFADRTTFLTALPVLNFAAGGTFSPTSFASSSLTSITSSTIFSPFLWIERRAGILLRTLLSCFSTQSLSPAHEKCKFSNEKSIFESAIFLSFI